MAVAVPAAGAADDEAAWLFDPGAVVEIDLDVSQASIDALEAEPDEYQPATFTLTGDGVTRGPLEVGLRLKGGASFRTFAGKAAFKVKFAEFVKGQKLDGLKTLTLNNMIQDRSMFHEALAYEVFRDFGVAAPRTGYAFIRVNGGVFGLYANVETLDDVALPQWFATTQHLYEGAAGKDVVPGNAAEFEVDEGDDEDLADLEALIVAANDDEGDWSEGMAAVAALEQMVRFWAVERYVGHWDGYAGSADPSLDNPNNFYLHSDAAGIFSFLPWGMDQAWDEPLRFDEPGGLLFNRCLGDASCRALYVGALEKLGPKVGALDLDRKAGEIAALLGPWQALEDPGRREASAADIDHAVASAREFIAARPAELCAWLGQSSCGSDGTGDRSREKTIASPPGRELWVGRSRVRGATIVTRLDLPAPGWVVQRVKVASGDGFGRACRMRKSFNRAGIVVARCRLAAWAQAKAARHSLRLRVEIGFWPTSGQSPSRRINRLTLPRD